MEEQSALWIWDWAPFHVGDVGGFGSSKIFQEGVEILGDLPILASDQTDELAKALETLLEWTNLSSLRTAFSSYKSRGINFAEKPDDSDDEVSSKPSNSTGSSTSSIINISLSKKVLKHFLHIFLLFLLTFSHYNPKKANAHFFTFRLLILGWLQCKLQKEKCLTWCQRRNQNEEKKKPSGQDGSSDEDQGKNTKLTSPITIFFQKTQKRWHDT